MRKIYFFAAFLALLSACGGRDEKAVNPTGSMADTLSLVLEGDSTVYGLACDGCNDTILVFLPLSNTAGDPDTFNVLEATRSHRVYGHLNVGDNVAVVRSTADTTVAQLVIDMEDLCHTWCYLATPTLKERADITPAMRKQFLSQMPDSVRDSLFMPREYGFTINADHTARPVGQYYRKDENSPVEYPKPHRYRQWQLLNGSLLLTRTELDSTGQQRAVGTDTAHFVLLRNDTLVLSFPDGPQSYYRKQKETDR